MGTMQMHYCLDSQTNDCGGEAFKVIAMISLEEECETIQEGLYIK